jgi:hypothetical protein
VHKPLKAQKNPAFTHEESDAEYSWKILINANPMKKILRTSKMRHKNLQNWHYKAEKSSSLPFPIQWKKFREQAKRDTKTFIDLKNIFSQNP